MPDFAVTAKVPPPTVPLTEENGELTYEWRRFFEALGFTVFGESGIENPVANAANAISNAQNGINVIDGSDGIRTVELVNPFTETEKDKLAGIEDNATADQTAVEIRTAVQNAPNSNVFQDSDRAKLIGIQDNATANSTDAQLRARSTHTGVQGISTVTGLQAALDSKIDNSALGSPVASASISDTHTIDLTLPDGGIFRISGVLIP